jgi:hypothetical protein
MIEKYGLKLYMARLAEVNYFNPSRRIVRAKVGEKSFDFHLLLSTSEVPNPKQHILILLTNEETIVSPGLQEEDLKYKPGNDKKGNPADVPLGGALLANINQTYATTNPQNASSTFNTDHSNMDVIDKVQVAITPPSVRPYTNNESATEKQSQDNNESFGVFMNNDAVLIKSRGGSIVLSDDGVHIGGPVAFESTQFAKDLMADNFLSSIIPSAFPTCLLAMQQLPNFQQFMRIAESAQKIVNVIEKSGKLISSVDSIVGALNA